LRTLDAIFRPRSVAVVGASTSKGKLGWEILHNIIDYEFNGTVFPVNPRAEFIHSIKAYPSVGEIPDRVDLAIIVVPAEEVLEVVEDCGKKGVQGLVIISAGFREIGGEGARREEKLVDLCARHGMRLIGPNCMGVFNAADKVRLNATFAPFQPIPGAVAYMSQSGALGMAILHAAKRLNIGISHFASVGNKADISGNDLLEYWEDDPNTRIIAMYLESFGDPRKFTQLARRISQKKPIIVVKSGRTEPGARAASSHTGALAAQDIAIDALLAQTGVVRAFSIDEMLHLMQAFTRCPLPAGNHVGVVTNAGGPGILAVDALVSMGLELAEFSEETKKKLSRFLPVEATVANPVDMIASAGSAEFEKGVGAVLEDENVHMVMAIFVPPRMIKPLDILEKITQLKAHHDKPVLGVFMAEEAFYEEYPHLFPDAPPIYRFPETAARACSALSAQSRWFGRPRGKMPTFEVDEQEARRILSQKSREGGGYLEQEDAYRVLEAYGIPVLPVERAYTLEEVLSAGEKLGYPLVLKVDGRSITHKSDVGGVRLGIQSMGDLSEAFVRMKKDLEKNGVLDRVEGYVVQPMAREGQEVIVGVVQDPILGPLLMFGMGGRYVEVFRDVTFRVLPVDDRDIEEMIRSIKGYALLEGVRGAPRVCMDVLSEVLLRVAQLIDRHHEIREMDLNPFILSSERKDCKAADVRIRVEAAPAPVPAS
jgi:acetyl coenzyme A synthetase (ADP forming)-like protein